MVLKFVSLRAIVRIIRRSTGNVSGWRITVGNNLTIAEFTAVSAADKSSILSNGTTILLE
jgi:hypothetical protein